MEESAQSPVLRDFWKWEEQASVEVVACLETAEKARFLPPDTLRTYFEAGDGEKLHEILAAVFESDDVPIHNEEILSGHAAVFCILLRIGKGRYVESFAQYEELSDQRLPFDPKQPPSYFSEAVEDDLDVLRLFCENQWMYCVPVFTGHMLNKQFGPQRLLPITSAEKLDGDDVQTRYKVQLYGPHNKLSPAGGKLPTSEAKQNTFILHQYTKATESSYKQEVNGFRTLKYPDTITKLWGSFIHGTSYNVLLEFADKGSLEKYFQRESPPSRGGDIIKFWESMFKLLDALKTIHAVIGSHQNVAPSSVMVMSYGAESPYDWKFKLADFGQNQTKGTSLSEQGAADDRPNLKYGAPECYMPYNLNDTQAADIWSVGCIYSEAAVWIADGYKGLTSYRKRRSTETGKISDFKGGDCFHDGVKVLSSVLDAHAGIDESLRRSDYITKDVLDSLVDEMLWDEDRPKAKALLRRADAVLSRARQKLPANNGNDSRPTSGGRSIPPQRLRPPTGPLPKIPVRPAQSDLSSIAERQYLPRVEEWRSRITPSQPIGLHPDGPTNSALSPIAARKEPYRPESLLVDADFNGSVSSWQNENDSVASPTTAFTSPHPSVIYDFDKQPLVGEEPSVPPLKQRLSQRSPEQRRPRALSRRPSHAASSDNGSVTSAPRSYSRGPALSYATSDNGNGISNEPVIAIPKTPPYPPGHPIFGNAPELNRAPSGPSYPASERKVIDGQRSSTPHEPAYARTYSPSGNISVAESPRIVPRNPAYTAYAGSEVSSAQHTEPREPPSYTPSDNEYIPIPPRAPSRSQQYTSPEPDLRGTSVSDTPRTRVSEARTDYSDEKIAIPPQGWNERTDSRGPFNARSRADDDRMNRQHVRHSSSIQSLSMTFTEAISSMRKSQDDSQVPTKSQKKSGFTLFPSSFKSKGTNGGPPFHPVSSFTSNKAASKSIVRPGTSHTATGSTHTASTAPPLPFSDGPESDYLSLNTALEWKKAHKKVKKKENIPQLPGSQLLQGLRDRDHTFIIDDSISMSAVWPDLKRLFEALTYITKGSPNGTELFYTISYDTFTRKDPADLCDHLDKKSLAGSTDIAYRLNLQLQAYTAKIINAKMDKKKKDKERAKSRPMNIYVLSNGEWTVGTEEKLKTLMTEFYESVNFDIKVQFISFARTAEGVKRIYDVVNGSDGKEGAESYRGMVDCEPWTGNVLRMLGAIRGMVGEMDSGRGVSHTGGDGTTDADGAPQISTPQLDGGGMWADEFV